MGMGLMGCQYDVLGGYILGWLRGGVNGVCQQDGSMGGDDMVG